MIKKITVLMILTIVTGSVLWGCSGSSSGAALSTIEKKNGISELGTSKDGNIYLEENEYFKKFTIRFPDKADEGSFSESGNFILINADKNVKLKLNSDSFSKNGKPGIYVKNEKNKNIIYIEKSYNSNNFIYTDMSDTRNVIVLISKSQSPFVHRVVLDAGHGAEDKGVNIGSLYEKNITLNIVKYMTNDLRYMGIEALPTRDTDKLLSLSEVAGYANKNKPGLFLSVHVNSFPESKYNGIETFYYYENGFQQKEREEFADTIEKYAVRDDGWNNRGTAKEELKVLRLSKSPCALVECGFLTNPGDRAKLQNQQVLSRLAQNLSEGINEYLSAK